MHLNQKRNKIMLMFIVICSGLVRIFYSTFVLDSTTKYLRQYSYGIKKMRHAQGMVWGGNNYFDLDELKDLLGLSHMGGLASDGGGSAEGGGVWIIKYNS